MSKVNWKSYFLLSEIKKRIRDISVRSRRPASRMDIGTRLQAQEARFFFVKLNFILGTPELHQPTAPQETQTFNCHYCGQPCQVSTHYQLNSNEQLRGWQCTKHRYTVEYVAVPDATYYAFYFTCWHNHREYSIEAYKLPQGEQWELKRGSETLMHLERIPANITPDSIDRRIGSLLLFS
jgi:hypothetical protein